MNALNFLRFVLPLTVAALFAAGTALPAMTAASANKETPTVSVADIPPWFPEAPLLPPPQGEVTRVATADDLLAAVERADADATILLSDGCYKLPRALVLQRKQDLTIRSASGDPAKVILSGKGWDSNARGDDVLHIGDCNGIMIASLTFADCRSYGIKVEAENAPTNIHIYNCRFRDIGVRAIKDSAGQNPNIRAVKDSIRDGVSLPEVTDDIRGRPRVGPTDLGAWESGQENR